MATAKMSAMIKQNNPTDGNSVVLPVLTAISSKLNNSIAMLIGLDPEIQSGNGCHCIAPQLKTHLFENKVFFTAESRSHKIKPQIGTTRTFPNNNVLLLAYVTFVILKQLLLCPLFKRARAARSTARHTVPVNLNKGANLHVEVTSFCGNHSG